MGELVLDKLTQKVSNMLDEIGDVNILVRRLTPTQETLNRINERVDAVFGALKQLEKGVQLDEQKLAHLEEQIALLKQGLESVNRQLAEELVSSFKGTAHELRAVVQRLEVKAGQLGELMRAVAAKSDAVFDRLDRFDTAENTKMGKQQQQIRLLGRSFIVLVVMV
jgi:chromosome segregation ATPase